MKSSKLIKILSTFSSKEFKEFEKYAINIFHKTEKMVSFVKFLSINHPKFIEEKINKEKVFKYVFPKEKYTDIRVRELMSALYKTVKTFLVQENISSNSFQYELTVLKEYNNRKLTNLYESQLKTVKNILAKDSYKNKEYYRRKYLVASVENDHFKNKHIRALDENIQNMVNNLDFFYFSTKLIESCEMLNRQKLLNQSYDFNLFSEIELIIEKNKDGYLKHPTIICYYEIYKLLQTENNVDQLNKTLKTLKDYSAYFTDNELKALFNFPQNYCIGNLNKGDNSYLDKLFDLQSYIIDKEFNLIKGYISNVNYDNIIAVALKLEKFDWSKGFIEEYKDKITPELRENSYNMNVANLNFALKNYDKTLTILNQVEFNDVYYAYFSKVLLLKTYFALEEFETLNYFVTAFKLYLKRNKEISTSFKNGANAFLVNFKRVLTICEKIEYTDSKKSIEKTKGVIESIDQEKNIHNRVWLLEIANKIIK